MPLTKTYTENYLYSAHFYVKVERWDGTIFDLYCQQVTGLEFNSDVVEYREGGNPVPYKAPGAMYNFGNITIRRAQLYYTAQTGEEITDFFIDWIKKCKNGEVLKANLEIQQLDRGGEIKKVWYVQGAFPTRYTPGDFDATSNDFIIEEIELAVSDIDEVLIVG